jgi:glutathione S-transferase
MISVAKANTYIFFVLLAALLPSVKSFSSAASSSSSSKNSNIVLWNSGVWPFAQRPWIALLEKGVEFEHKLIDLSNKPRDFLERYQAASGRAYGAGLVPLLEHDGNLVIESDVVAKYVSQHIKGVDGRGNDLYPTNKADEELIKSFMNNWGHVTDTYYSVLTATSEKEVKKRKTSFIQSLDIINNLLKQRSSGAFLLGSAFSYAECISAPWIQRFYVTLPYFRGIDFEEDILNSFDLLPQWMGAVCGRPSCMVSICPEEEMIAACKRYYVSYISPRASGFL